MSVVGFKIDGLAGPLWLDAGGAEGSNQPNTAMNVKSDVTPPALGIDNIWNLHFSWDPATKVGSATIGDATVNNRQGPQMLRLNLDAPSQKYKGVVLGRVATMAPKWSVGAAGPITALAQVPVRLWLNVPPAGGGNAAPCYLTPAQSPTPAECVMEGRFGVFENAHKWTLDPIAGWIPPAAYTGLVVETFTVQSMLVDIWNRCVGTEWGKTYAGSLLAWMYDYPNAWHAEPQHADGVNPIWATHVTTKLYDKVYKPYFVENKPDFGSGDPPDDGPPPRMGGGRPPHKHG